MIKVKESIWIWITVYELDGYCELMPIRVDDIHEIHRGIFGPIKSIIKLKAWPGQYYSTQPVDELNQLIERSKEYYECA